MSGAEAGRTAQSDRVARLRAERAAALARRGTGVAVRRGGVAHLVCACGTERYGLPLAAVAQVLPSRPATPVPGAGPAVLGVIALSGRIVGVLGLARALGRPETVAHEGGHLVVLRGTPPLAFAVDRALGIASAGGREAAGTDGVGTEGPGAGLGIVAASGYAPADAADGSPDFVVLDLPRLLPRFLGALP